MRRSCLIDVVVGDYIGSPAIRDCALAAVETLDVGICVCDPQFAEVLYANQTFVRLVAEREQEREALLVKVPSFIATSVRCYVDSRQSMGRLPDVLPVDGPNGQRLYLRVLPAPSPWRYEVILARQELMRDPLLFRELESRFRITRREFQIVAGFRVGKTNRALSEDLGVSEHRLEKLIAHLLEKFGMTNRHQVAQRVEQIAARRS